jgi:hypothetical protein
MNTPAQAELGRGTLGICGRRLGPATRPARLLTVQPIAEGIKQ